MTDHVEESNKRRISKETLGVNLLLKAKFKRTVTAAVKNEYQESSKVVGRQKDRVRRSNSRSLSETSVSVLFY